MPRAVGKWQVGRRSLVTVLTLSLGLLLVAVGLVGCTPDNTEISPAAANSSQALLLAEIHALREGLTSGDLVVDPNLLPVSDALPLTLERLDSVERQVLSPVVHAYLKDSAGNAEELLSQASVWPGVKKVTFVSKDEALARLEEDFKDSPEIIEDLAGNPLPAVIEIEVEQLDTASEVVRRLGERPEVDQVQDPTVVLNRILRELKSYTRPGCTSRRRNAPTRPELTLSPLPDI